MISVDLKNRHFALLISTIKNRSKRMPQFFKVFERGKVKRVRRNFFSIF